MADYAAPVPPLKKVDVAARSDSTAGPRISEGDASQQVLLSHIEHSRSARQERQIGAGTEFGAVDVLISANQDYDRRAAFEYLRDYFPRVPHPELSTLLHSSDHRIKAWPPRLLEEGQVIRTLHLIVSGVVERVSGGEVRGGGFPAGSLIGEVAALAGDPQPISTAAAPL